MAELTGLDKAAILFQVLGDGLAVTIFKDLSDGDLRRVRLRAREITGIPFQIKKAVLEEFYFSFLAEKFKDTGEGSKRPFAFLDKLTDEQIAYLIVGEPPRIAAVVLAQLDGERQMRIYERLDHDQRVDALMALGDGEGMTLEAVVSIAGELREKTRYMPKTSEYERGSGEKLAGMLGRMPIEQADLFLEKLSHEDPEMYQEVKRHYLTFEDIFQLPDGPLRDVLIAVDLDDLAVAFKGMDEDIIDKAIEALPKKKQAMYEPVEEAISKREMNRARSKIMKQVRKLQDEGSINISELLSDDLLE